MWKWKFLKSMQNQKELQCRKSYGTMLSRWLQRIEQWDLFVASLHKAITYAARAFVSSGE